MSVVDNNIIVEFDTGRDCKTQYLQRMQCIICKQIKQSEECISKRSKRIYNKSCRVCLGIEKSLGLKGRNAFRKMEDFLRKTLKEIST